LRAHNFSETTDRRVLTSF